jgi:hypothetical protein
LSGTHFEYSLIFMIFSKGLIPCGINSGTERSDPDTPFSTLPSQGLYLPAGRAFYLDLPLC